MRFGRLAVLACAIGLAPTAAAEFTLTAQPSPEPLAPGSETTQVRFEVTDDCQDLLTRAGPGSQGVPFTLQAKTSSPYIVRIGAASGELPLAPCLEGQPTSNATIDWTMGVRPDAPGLEALASDVEAILHAMTATAQERTSAHVRVMLRAKAILDFEIVTPAKVVKTQGDRGVLHFTLINHGNVKATYSFGLTDAPSSGSVELPEAMILYSPLSGLGSSTNGTLVYKAGSGSWDQVGFTFNVTATAFVDPGTHGGPVSTSVIFRNGNALERTVPAPAFPLAFLALALAAAVARRRA